MRGAEGGFAEPYLALESQIRCAKFSQICSNWHCQAKVEGSNPFIRSSESPATRGVFLLSEVELERRCSGVGSTRGWQIVTTALSFDAHFERLRGSVRCVELAVIG